MAELKDIQKIEFLKSMKMAQFFLKKRTKYVLLYLLIVPGMLFFRTVIWNCEDNFYEALSIRNIIIDKNGNQRFSIAPAEMIIFMLYKFWWWCIEFVSKMTFEMVITPIGGVLAQFLLHKMLLSENHSIFDVSPSTCEYTITQGSRNLAIIIRLIFIGFVSNSFVIFKEFYFIYTRADPEYRKYTIMIILFYLIIAAIKIYHLNKIFYLAYGATQLNSEKEKIYSEAIDYLNIVKSSQEESKVMTKYKKVLTRWESFATSLKLFEYSNVFIFTLGFESITACAIMFYINNLVFKGTKNSKTSENDFPRLIGLTSNYYKVICKIPNLINTALKIYSELTEAIVLSQRLLEYMVYTRDDIKNKRSIKSFKEKIEAIDINYSSKEKLIFSGVDFVINKGDKIALFGRNGTGKSSIFKLILGFDDCKGSIKIDGIDINRLSMPEYRSLFTFVPQDTKLFDETIFYNLTFGNNRTYKEVIEECKKMKIHDTIMTFSNGYNTQVGEGGKNLNGGLRQKIFYTRAFLRDTEIYMFDEPTNNLDLINSEFLLEYMKDPKYSEKTFFVITHELKIVREFPKIFHFDEGKINIVETV